MYASLHTHSTHAPTLIPSMSFSNTPKTLLSPHWGLSSPLSVSPHWAFVPMGANDWEELRVCVPVIVLPLLWCHESWAGAVALGLFCQQTQHFFETHKSYAQPYSSSIFLLDKLYLTVQSLHSHFLSPHFPHISHSISKMGTDSGITNFWYYIPPHKTDHFVNILGWIETVSVHLHVCVRGTDNMLWAEQEMWINLI